MMFNIHVFFYLDYRLSNSTLSIFYNLFSCPAKRKYVYGE